MLDNSKNRGNALIAQRISDDHYDDPTKGKKVRKHLEKNGLTDIDEMIENCVLCSANLVDPTTGKPVCTGVRICIREMADLVDALSPNGTDPTIASTIHRKTEKKKKEINERCFNEQCNSNRQAVTALSCNQRWTAKTGQWNKL